MNATKVLHSEFAATLTQPRTLRYELALVGGRAVVLDCQTGTISPATVGDAYQRGFDVQSRDIQNLFLAGGMTIHQLSNEVNYLARETNAGGANWAQSHATK